MVVLSALDQRPRGRRFESDGCGLSCSNRGPIQWRSWLGIQGSGIPPPSAAMDRPCELCKSDKNFFGKGWRVGVVTCIQYAKCAYVICSNRPACHVHCRGLSTLSTPPQLVSCRVPAQQTPTTSTAARKRFHASLTDHQAVSK